MLTLKTFGTAIDLVSYCYLKTVVWFYQFLPPNGPWFFIAFPRTSNFRSS